MPTGYTAELGEKDNMSFEEFVWNCARAFGAFMHMRDEGLNAEITMPKEDSYHRKGILEATRNLEKYQKMSLSQARVALDAEYERTQQSARESIEKNAKTLARYERMRKMVADWVPPSEDHAGLKKFMLEQIDSSIKFDCGGDYWTNILKEKKLTPKQWLKKKIEDAEHDIKYHTEHANKEREGHKKVVEWINLLQHNVPMPKKVSKK